VGIVGCALKLVIHVEEMVPAASISISRTKKNTGAICLLLVESKDIKESIEFGQLATNVFPAMCMFVSMVR